MSNKITRKPFTNEKLGPTMQFIAVQGLTIPGLTRRSRFI